jgi:ADP-heptose:LPS heptosyltransferase
LLDVRIPGDPDVHEVERALAVVGALGFPLPPGDDGALALRRDLGPPPPLPDRFVVVHPSASVPARTLSPDRWKEVVAALRASGWHVVVTGGADDRPLGQALSGGDDGVHDLTSATTFAGLAATLARAAGVVCGNTATAHLAAAVGTPVVDVFAPTVRPQRWRPWKVEHRLLGDLSIACAGCRSRQCPVPGQPCFDPVTPAAVVDAVHQLIGRRDRPRTVRRRAEVRDAQEVVA